MSSRVISNLYKKEMLDVLRDKKTVLMMLVVPLVLYPLVFIVGLQIMAGISSDMSEKTYRIAFSNIDEGLDDFFKNIQSNGYSFDIIYMDNPQEALKAEDIDAYIECDEGEDGPVYKVRYLSAVVNSSYAVDIIDEVLGLYKNSLIKERLCSEGLAPDEILSPIKVSYEDMASNEESAGSLLGTIIPFMLVVSLILGTMYPAIDTTAGERERGTLETVLTLPVSNQELIMSKFLTVATIGVVSAVLNILSMCGVGVYMYNMMQTVTDEAMGIDMSRFMPAILVGVLCILAFAVFISAVTMCVCAFAKSYKEANNYITPLMLIVMFASFIGFIPNVSLTANMALAPVVNICLLIRDLLAFKVDIGIIIIVLMSNMVYGILAITFLGKIYSSERVLFGDGSSGVQLFERRRNMKKGGVPTMGDAWLIIAVAAVAIVYIGGFMQISFGYYGILGTQLLIIGIPLAAAIYTKKNIKETFRIRGFSLSQLVGSIFMIFGAVLIGMLITAFSSMIFTDCANNLQTDMEGLLGGSFLSTLFVVAIAPAICEELMFRGYIFSAFEKRLKMVYAVLLTAALFGAYHMSVVKFFTTAFIGGIICVSAYYTQSIFTGIIMHFLNNAISVVYMYFPDEISGIIPVLGKDYLTLTDVVLIFFLGCSMLIFGYLIIRKRLFKRA